MNTIPGLVIVFCSLYELMTRDHKVTLSQMTSVFDHRRVRRVSPWTTETLAGARLNGRIGELWRSMSSVYCVLSASTVSCRTPPIRPILSHLFCLVAISTPPSRLRS